MPRIEDLVSTKIITHIYGQVIDQTNGNQQVTQPNIVQSDQDPNEIDIQGILKEIRDQNKLPVIKRLTRRRKGRQVSMKVITQAGQNNRHY